MMISASQMSLRLKSMQAKERQVSAFSQKVRSVCNNQTLHDIDPDKVRQAVTGLELLKKEVQDYRYQVDNLADAELLHSEKNPSSYGTMKELQNQKNQLLKRLDELSNHLTYVIRTCGDGNRSAAAKLHVAIMRQVDNHFNADKGDFSAYNSGDVLVNIIWLIAFFKSRFNARNTES